MTIASPLEVITVGPARAAARLFRCDGRLHVVVIAKARLLLVPDGPMRASEPRDVYDGASVGDIGETVPYRLATDVVLRAPAGGRRGSPPDAAARLALLRPLAWGGGVEGAETLLHKAVPVHEAHKLGPHAQAVGAASLAAPAGALAEAPLPELSSAIDFSCFQAAQADQRAQHLRGDEWLWLEHLHPTIERVASQLPLLRAVGAIRLPHQDKPFLMRIDTLSIDGENAWCDVLARGSFAIASHEELGRLQLIAGFEIGRAVGEASVRPLHTSRGRSRPCR